jgi:hypothetical protein
MGKFKPKDGHIRNRLQLSDRCVENLQKLYTLLATPYLELDMGMFLTSDEYISHRSTACPIGHAFHNDIGTKVYSPTNHKRPERPNYLKYSEENFMPWQKEYKGMLIWKYLFGEDNKSSAKLIRYRINLLLYSKTRVIKKDYRRHF